MKKGILIVIGLLAIAAVLVFMTRDEPAEPKPPPVADASTRTSTATGHVVGYVEPNGARAWLGIPFARPPSGELRWRAPEPPEPWEGDLEAVTAADVCPQIGSFLGTDDPEQYGSPVGSEDCLYLNVWAPADADGSSPVMFWIHGGGNTIGHGGSASYSGANLAATHDVVVVSINYRLGPFGWFSHPALKQSTDDVADRSGNYGTLDVIRGLEWVQENVRNFGGDPGNVTIFGESAGGVNVLTMMASPLAEGLYHRAIVQSGGLFVSPMSAAENYAPDGGHDFSAREIVNALLVARGRATNREVARDMQETMAPAEIEALLRSVPAHEFLELYSGSFGGMLDMPTVFGDGHVLPAGIDSSALFSDTANYNVTPVMLGTNRDEVKLFMMMSGEQTRSIFGVPYGLEDEDAYNRNARYASDAWKVRGVDDIASSLVRAQGDGVYAYRFDWDEQRSVLGLFDLSTALGAAHGLEIAFVFGNFGGGLGFDMYDEASIPARDELSQQMMSYWAEFAYTGKPGKGRDGDQVEWKPWQNGTDKERLMVLDTSRDRGIRMTNELITMEDLKARFLADDSFADAEARCAGYRQLFFGAEPDREEMASIGCADEG